MSVWQDNAGKWWYQFRWKKKQYSGPLMYQGTNSKEASREAEPIRKARRAMEPKLKPTPNQRGNTAPTAKPEGLVVSFAFSDASFATMINNGVRRVVLQFERSNGDDDKS